MASGETEEEGYAKRAKEEKGRAWYLAETSMSIRCGRALFAADLFASLCALSAVLVGRLDAATDTLLDAGAATRCSCSPSVDDERLRRGALCERTAHCYCCCSRYCCRLWRIGRGKQVLVRSNWYCHSLSPVDRLNLLPSQEN